MKILINRGRPSFGRPDNGLYVVFTTIKRPPKILFCFGKGDGR